MDWLVQLLSTIITVVISIASLAYWLGRKFAEIDARFRIIDERFRQIEEKFERIEERFGRIDERFERLEHTMKSMVRSVLSCTQAMQHMLIDFMSVKGLFTREERDFLVREVDRFATLHQYNPLKPEEAKFIKQVMEEIRTKDPKEFEMWKLDKVMEIFQRLFEEEPTPEVAKMLLYVYTLKRILQKERGEL